MGVLDVIDGISKATQKVRSVLEKTKTDCSSLLLLKMAELKAPLLPVTVEGTPTENQSTTSAFRMFVFSRIRCGFCRRIYKPISKNTQLWSGTFERG